MKDRKKLFVILDDYVVLTLGVIIFTVAWEVFMIPNGMSSGGLMGLCTVIEYATGGRILASYSFLAINSLLILISVLALGIGFGFKTLYCILMSSLMLKVFDGLDFLHAVPGNFFYVPERVLIPIISGVLEAVGIGLILRRGGSSGGTDIVAIMVNKYWPVSLSEVFLLSDLIIITAILFLPGKAFGDMVYGYEMMVTFSLVIDVMMVGQKSSVQLMVFSEHYGKIADYIINEMDRGATILKAQGWYTKKDKNILLIMLKQKELPEISRVIKSIDRKAFMSVTQAGSVYGEGFEEIKTGISRKRKENA
ncbi:MAG: YitT family protein [Bacteroidales bacterium]|nr:YitT family protein [Bacteroidales bacterium]